LTANEKKNNENNVKRNLETRAPAAKIKLEKKIHDVEGLYVGEIEAVLFQIYNVLMQGKSNLRKFDYVKK